MHLLALGKAGRFSRHEGPPASSADEHIQDLWRGLIVTVRLDSICIAVNAP